MFKYVVIMFFFNILSPASDWFEFRLVLISDPCEWTRLSMRVENVFHASEPELFMQVGHVVHTSGKACSCKWTRLSIEWTRGCPCEWTRLSMRVDRVVHVDGPGHPCEWNRLSMRVDQGRPCEWTRLSMRVDQLVHRVD